MGSKDGLRKAIAVHRARWFQLAPETWRRDLLRVVLRTTMVLGGAVYIPSAFFVLKHGMPGILVLDTVAVVTLAVLTFVRRIPEKVRAASTCLVAYALGVGLLLGVGPVSQVYLFAFSILTALVVSIRWGLASVALNAVTMLSVGYLGILAPAMVVPHWGTGMIDWSVITFNFVFLNFSVVLAMGAVIGAMEHERTGLATLNESLGAEVQKRAGVEASLRENRALLRIAGRTARLGGWQVDLGAQHVVWSDEVCELHEVPTGTSPSLEAAVAFYAPESRAAISLAVDLCIREGRPYDVEAKIITATGARLWVRTIGSAVRDETGLVTSVQGSVQDITPQKVAEAQRQRLEEQLRQAQKMETIGGLAGGVAHDFNNLLSVILSYSDLMAGDLKPDDPMRADLAEIQGAGLRAAELTRQLLAFSRQQALAPVVVDLSTIVEGMENMLARLIGEDVELAVVSSPDLENIRVDPGQMEQVIMNLAVNARDAMPRGGMLTIETANVVLDEGYASEHVGVTPGKHVMLAVTDAGTGIDAATQARMFEPFFTTKEQGKGTGLGLATVFGIVRQSGGTIWAYSEVGVGTTFKVYFPIVEGAVVEAVAAPEAATLRGSETILLVEDEESVRVLLCTILRKYGYHVLEAKSGGDALVLSGGYPARIHLLVTDVVMPQMSGRELAERLQPLRSDMKVLFASGYTDDAVVRHGILDATLAFVQKPITPDAVLRKVRAVLSGATGA